MPDNYLTTADGVNLFYHVAGSTDPNLIINPDQPSLIFLHGGPGVVDHTLYLDFWSQLEGVEIQGKRLQVIFIDQRGCGRSYHEVDGQRDYGDPEKWKLMQWGQDVFDFFTYFGLTKPIIAGVSFGGVVAMSCATQFPDALGGLILCDTDAKFDLDEVLKRFYQLVLDKADDTDKEEDVRHRAECVCQAAKNMFTNTNPDTYREYVKTCIPYCAKNPYDPKKIARCIKNEASALLYNQRELTHYNFLPGLEQVTCPTLVLAGDQNPVHNLASARKTAEAIRSDLCTFILYEGAGSPVYAEKNNEVIVKNNMIEFLQGLHLDLTNPLQPSVAEGVTTYVDSVSSKP